MRIFDAPLKDCLDALGGAPYRVGDFAITRHAQGFECVAEGLPRIAFSMPDDATLLDARRYVTIFDAGFAAGAENVKRGPGSNLCHPMLYGQPQSFDGDFASCPPSIQRASP